MPNPSAMEAMVTGPSCAYGTLSTYNAPWAGVQTGAAPNNNSGYYVVPNYAAIGVDALSKPFGIPGNCNGYFSLTSAYGPNAANCSTNYITRLCNQ